MSFLLVANRKEMVPELAPHVHSKTFDCAGFESWWGSNFETGLEREEL